MCTKLYDGSDYFFWDGPSKLEERYTNGSIDTKMNPPISGVTHPGGVNERSAYTCYDPYGTLAAEIKTGTGDLTTYKFSEEGDYYWKGDMNVWSSLRWMDWYYDLASQLYNDCYDPYKHSYINPGRTGRVSRYVETDAMSSLPYSKGRYSDDLHLYVEDESWEMKQYLPAQLSGKGGGSPGIFRLYQYGVIFGGPIMKDKLWFFGSYSVQDIHSRTIAQTEDDTWLQGHYGKIDFQFGNTSGMLQYSNDNKLKWGRTSIGTANPAPETTWDQQGPGGVYLGSLQQVMGNLMLNAKFAYTDGGFTLDPRSNADGWMVRQDDRVIRPDYDYVPTECWASQTCRRAVSEWSGVTPLFTGYIGDLTSQNFDSPFHFFDPRINWNYNIPGRN